MSIDISGIAYAIRSDSAQSHHPIRLSHAQQCVAAALGHKSLAALQASEDAGLPLDADTHILLDAGALAERRIELGLAVTDEALLSLVQASFEKRLGAIPIHTSRDVLENAVRDAVDQRVLNDGAVSGEMAVTNNDGIREIYLPFDIDWEDVPDDGDPYECEIDGHVSMEIDKERPYVGHRIAVQARVTVSRPGRAVWTVACEVESAKLRVQFGENDDEEEAPPRVSLAEALADELALALDEAEALVDAQFDELASGDGVVYGYEFDFSDLELPSELQRKLARKAPALRVTVAPHFFDRVDAREHEPRRHYVHGDQVEGDPARYFCASCDFFVPGAHFETKHPGEGEDRFFSSMRTWQRRPARTKIGMRRPATATNILEAAALASRAAREAARGGFHKWLEGQLKRNDPVGDLARDVMGDRKFPVGAPSLSVIEDYLELQGAMPDAIAALRAAWNEFQAADRS